MQKSQAIEHFGGVPNLAKMLNISRQAIYKWPDQVPELWQYKLHHLSGGLLPITSPQVSSPPH